MNRGWISYLQRTFAIRRQLEHADINPALRPQLETALRAVEKTLGEQFHTATENRAIPLLNALRTEDASFYADVDTCMTFIQFIVFQYFRTAKLRNEMLAIKNPLPHDIEQTWPIEALIYATNVGASLFQQRNLYDIVFLRNTSIIPFITADQPIINLNGIEDEHLALYYPITPTLAVIYTADRMRYTAVRYTISTIEVENYNFEILCKI